jgi:glycine cleavage system H protein
VSSRSISEMTFPENLRYGPEHEWVQVGEDGVVTMGITDFAQDQLGDVEYVDLPAEGAETRRGEAIAEVESTKTASEVYAPCTGTVVERNEKLVDDPSLINSDPYAAWFIRISPSAPDELSQLADAAGYRDRLDG